MISFVYFCIFFPPPCNGGKLAPKLISVCRWEYLSLSIWTEMCALEVIEGTRGWQGTQGTTTRTCRKQHKHKVTERLVHSLDLSNEQIFQCNSGSKRSSQVLQVHIMHLQVHLLNKNILAALWGSIHWWSYNTQWKLFRLQFLKYQLANQLTSVIINLYTAVYLIMFKYFDVSVSYLKTENSMFLHEQASHPQQIRAACQHKATKSALGVLKTYFYR